MPSTRVHAILLTLALLASAATALARDPVLYRVSAPHPASHWMEIRVQVPAEYGCPDLAFSIWTPGGYVLRPKARNVLTATFTAGDGSPLQATRPDLNTWSVDCGGTRGFAATFLIRAVAERTPYTAHVDDRLLFANTVEVLPYLPAFTDAPARLSVEAPADWTLLCSLPAAAEPGTFAAPDWDTLADAILAAAPRMSVLRFRVDETDFTVAWTRPLGEAVDTEKVLDAHRRLAEAARDTFGGLPFDRYLFLYKVGPQGARGGLEHAFGTAMGFPETSLESTKKVLDSMGLASHEFVHAWNVKRARPRGLRPYDYAHVQRTDLLWVAEGWTSYYGPLLLVRAGIDTLTEFYRALTRRIGWHRSNPGNRFFPLTRFSADAWLEWPIPFVSFRSYYTRGSLTALDLDLRLRHATAGQRSLDDIMRALLTEPRLIREGYTEADLRHLATRLAGRPMDPWFERTVHRPGYMDLEEALETVGLRLVPDPEKGPRSFTGLGLESGEHEGGGVALRWVEPGSPAEAAGLGEGDVLLAVDGITGDAKELREAIRTLPPERSVELTIRRGRRILELPMTPAVQDPLRTPVRVEEDREATPEQVAALKAWLWME